MEIYSKKLIVIMVETKYFFFFILFLKFIQITTLFTKGYLYILYMICLSLFDSKISQTG